MSFSTSTVHLVPASWQKSLESLYQGRNTSTIRKGERIRLDPHQVLIVCRGMVQLSTLRPNGDEGILGLIRPSQPFGLPLTQLDSYDAIALTEVVLMQVSILDIEQSPHLAQNLFRELMQRLKQTEALLAIAQERTVDTRLRKLFDFLRQEMGQPTAQGVKLSVRLTHQQLAGMIGTTRVSVTRLLKAFREEGWLSMDLDRHFLFTRV
jgi:CRP-like cAMP-binding protein